MAYIEFTVPKEGEGREESAEGGEGRRRVPDRENEKWQP